MPQRLLRSPGLHVVYARALAGLLEQRGLASARSLNEAGFDLSGGEAWLPIEVLARVFAVLPRLEPDLGFALGARLQAHAHGQVGVAALASATLGESLQVLADHAHLRFAGVRWSMRRTARASALEMHLHADLGAAQPYVCDALIEVLLALLRALVGGLPGSLRIRMRRADATRAALHAAHWPAPVSYQGERELGLWLANAELQQACTSADPEALHSARIALDRSKAGLPPGISHRVASLLGGGESGWPDARAVALRLGLSLRSLHRHLEAEGQSFRTVLEARRREEALRLLGDRRVAIEQVAAELGYADAANFRRSCRRWFGRPPRELRKSVVEVAACA